MGTEHSLSSGGNRPPVALIAGPTASGKSDLAVELGRALDRSGVGSVIINADSAQVYADLAVLSARPAPEEMGGIAHRLYGTWDGAHACSAADWAEAARTEIRAAITRRQVPILVGGTGMYIRTLLDGIAPVPPIDPQIRADVRALPVALAHAALAVEDPPAAARLHPADTTRVARALEVIRSTGQPLSRWQAERTGGIAGAIRLFPAVLMPDRTWLYDRCDRRFQAMLENGAAAEVEALLRRNLSPDLPVMRAIGVPEIAGMLRGEWTMDEAVQRGTQATRNYVKRQMTWLRHQVAAEWPVATSHPYNMNGLFEGLFQFLRVDETFLNV